MALSYKFPTIQGTNSERTGGTWTNLSAGWIFVETDTGRTYYWTGSAWTFLSARPRIQFNFPTGTGTVGTPFAVRYGSVSSAFLTSTEALVQLTYPFDFTVLRMIAKLSSNTLDGSTTISFRDDGADVTGTPRTIAAASTTESDSGALSVAVAAGSKINFKVDYSASTTGTFLISHAFVIGELSL